MTSRAPAIVTGAGRGIGRAVAIRLSRTGHPVTLTARDRVALAETAASCPGTTTIVAGDITDPATIENVFSTAEREYGSVGVVILNAGAGSSAPIAAVTDEDWAGQLDLNLTAPFRCVRRAVPSMRETAYGRIVAIASTAAKRGDSYLSAYAAAKHGLLGLVRATAAELATTGITVNAVCPGYVDTPMTDRTVAQISARTGRTEDGVRALLAAEQPIGRLITPEEVADAVMLCVDTSAITGQGINVDGGAVQS